MKRIFHIISHLELGGAERVAINIAQSANPDYEYHVVEVIRGRSEYTHGLLKELQTTGIRYHRSPVPVFISFHYVFERFAAILFPLWFFFLYRKYRPSVIHSHTDIPDMAVYLLYRWFRKMTKETALVRTIHNTRLWVGMESKGKRIEQIYQQAQANVAISEATADYYQQRFGMRPPIIFNGIAIPRPRSYQGLKTGRLNIVFAGRFEAQKGVGALVDIVKMLADDNRYFFHIFGSGTQEFMLNELRSLPNVTIGPPLQGLPAYLASFDYVLMPSLHEGLATLSIEASLSHIPTIINDCPGLRDTLPKDWPLKVHGNDLEEYRMLFEKIISNGKERLWGEKAYAFASNRFLIQQMQDNYEKLYASRTN